MLGLVHPFRESQAPLFNCAARQRPLQVRMARSVTAIAQRDQIRWFIHSTARSRNQMMNIGVAIIALRVALSATMIVAVENNRPHFAPL